MIREVFNSILEGFGWRKPQPVPEPYFYRLNEGNEPVQAEYDEPVEQRPYFSKIELDGMTRSELVEVAGSLGIWVYKSWNKDRIKQSILKEIK